MLDDRPQADRVLAARIHGTAKAHARWRELTEAEHVAAAGELRELAGGRADLLPEVAGILEGASEGKLDEPLARQAARLCRDAGAALDAIPAWIEEVRRRASNSGMPPFSAASRRRPGNKARNQNYPRRNPQFPGSPSLPATSIASPAARP